MRRRLIVTYVSLLAVVLIGLSVPLGMVLAASAAQAMFIDRLDDTARFASLAEPALLTGNTAVLEAELSQYDTMFGIAVAVVDRDNKIVISTRPDVDLTQPYLRGRVESALSGKQTGLSEAPWPWEDDPLAVAVPVGSGGDIIGAAVTVSPSDALNAATMRGWTLLFVLSLLILALGVIASIPLSRWMMRPVLELDRAAQAVARGRFAQAVTVEGGPPELRRLTRTFTMMARNITALLDRQRTFASYASHQLRTPLATLRLSVENLGPSVRADGADDYFLLASEIERLAGMCDALLSYALADVVEGDLQVQDAGAIADARIAAWRPAAQLAGVELARHGAANAPVRANPQALDQALDALLSNAIKFARPTPQSQTPTPVNDSQSSNHRPTGNATGPVASTGTVTVTVDRIGDRWVEIQVADTGPGIPVEHLARAAEPFWRGPSHQNLDGSGLGITIAQALIRASGGTFELSAASPHGLQVRLRLRQAGGDTTR